MSAGAPAERPNLARTAPRRVLRYTVPIDDEPHVVAAGPVLMAHPDRRHIHHSAPARQVEVWVESEVVDVDGIPTPTGTRSVQVFGTFHPLPTDSEWLASCIDGFDNGEHWRLVWHVYGVRP